MEYRIRKASPGDAEALYDLMIEPELNCFAVRWQVAPWNFGGRRFYERLGAVEDREWVTYALEGKALDRLASSSDQSL